MSSTDIQGYYLTTEERQFTVSVTNPANGGTFGETIYYKFQISDAGTGDVASLVCNGVTVGLTQESGNLVGRVGPFPMPASQSWNTPCTVKFNTAKVYNFSVSMVDGASTPPDFELYKMTAYATVYTKPTITPTNMGGPYLVGIAQDFKLTITNPSQIPAPFELVFNFPAGTTLRYSGTDYNCPGNVCTIPVEIPNASNELTFTATFAAAMSGNITVTLKDSDWTPTHRDLASLTQGVVVYANYTVSGTFSMQGRIFRGGIPVTLTSTEEDFPYGPWTVNSTDNLGVNWVKSNVAVSTYKIVTNQPRYLNIGNYDVEDQDVTKSVTVDGAKTLSSLWLRGGNAVWTDNVIDVNDASKVGTDWGSTDNPDGNVNFDSIVNIQDLALVGGNFGLTSATAYASWTP